MRIALLNDSHAGSRAESPIFNEYFFQFFETVFFPYLKDQGIKMVFHLGDLFDRRKYVNYVILKSWKDRFFNRLQEEDIQFHMILGNHDIFYNNTSEVNSPQQLLQEYKNIAIYTMPTEITLDGLTVTLLPWINDDNESKSFDLIRRTKASIVFAHLALTGFEMDAGNMCYNGMDDKPFAKFQKVITGHFHHKSSKSNIHYLGAQYQQTWGDWNDPKGFHVFDTGTLDLEFIKNPHEMFHKVWYDDTKQDIDYWLAHDMSIYMDRYVKIIVTNKSNPFIFDKVVDLFYQNNPADIQIVDDYGTTIEYTEEDAISETEDTLSIINSHVDSLIIDARYSKDRVKDMMRELYMEALTTGKA